MEEEVWKLTPRGHLTAIFIEDGMSYDEAKEATDDIVARLKERNIELVDMSGIEIVDTTQPGWWLDKAEQTG